MNRIAFTTVAGGLADETIRQRGVRIDAAMARCIMPLADDEEGRAWDEEADRRASLRAA